jgi:hypothetical protein
MLGGSVVLTNRLGSLVTCTMRGFLSRSGANITVGGTSLSSLVPAINSDKATTGITSYTDGAVEALNSTDLTK